MKLLWVIPDGDFRRQRDREGLERVENLAVETASAPLAALDFLLGSHYDVVLADFPFPDWTPEEWIEEVQRINSLLPVIIREAHGSFRNAVRLTKLGAYQYLDAAGGIEEIVRTIEDAAEYRQERERVLFGPGMGQEPWRRFLIGESRAMRKVIQTIQLVAARRCTVLITGDTGTGKEVVARAIHMASGRGHLPMVAVNCSALPEALLEAELFGHVRGAFTGAINHRIGRFEQAHRSTLFLDEIGDMPLDLQAKLLRVLQEREFQRLGSSETVSVDIRVVAASNADLAELVRQSRFREDLYYRLNVVPIRVPPLAEHSSDIPLLVIHFIDKICRQEDIPPKRVTQETIERLCNYPWPGNVRQLENAVEMAIALSGDRETLYPGDFPLPSPSEWKPKPNGIPLSIRLPDEGLDFERAIGRIEQSILAQALQKSGGNKKAAAELLRLKRTTFAAKLKSAGAAASW